MKGIVADIHPKYIVVLSSDGRFIKMRNNGLYSVGSEIDTGNPLRANLRLAARTASIAAGILLVFGLGYGAYSYTVPYSYVDVDINPSIEITTNVFDRILKAEGLNDDGQKLLQADGITNSRLDEGIAHVLNSAVEQGYLNEESAENAIVMTVVTGDDKKSEKLQKKVEVVVNTELETDGISSNLVVSKASHEERENAKKKGLTPGKLSLIEKAVDAEPRLKVEDLKDAPVKDILKQIKENRKNSGKEDELGKTVGKKADDTDAKSVNRNNGKNTDGKDPAVKSGPPADKNGGSGKAGKTGDKNPRISAGPNKGMGPFTSFGPYFSPNKGTVPNKASDADKGANYDKNSGPSKNTGPGKSQDSNKRTNPERNPDQDKNTGPDKKTDLNKNNNPDRNGPGIGNNGNAGSKGNSPGAKGNSSGAKGNNPGGKENGPGRKDNGKSGSPKGFQGFNFSR